MMLMVHEPYSDILIRCPMPNNSHVEPQRLGDFMRTELGQSILGSSIENIEALKQAGLGEEQALTIALGAAAVRDENGTIMRQSSQDNVEVRSVSGGSQESKKK